MRVITLTTLFAAFSCLAALPTAAIPKITEVTPTKGSCLGGTKLTLTGSGFDPRGRSNKVYIGDSDSGVTCDPIPRECDEDRIVCTTEPFEGRDEYTVTVSSGNSIALCENSNGCTFAYSYDVTPRVTKISPEWTFSGRDVTIFGSKFAQGDATIEAKDFNMFIGKDQQRASIGKHTVQSSTCKVTVGKDTFAGSMNMSLSMASRGTSYVQAFSSNVDVVPEIHAIYPNSGSALGGQEVTIFGSGFSRIKKQNKVWIHRTRCTVIQVTGDYLVCKTRRHKNGRGTTTKMPVWKAGKVRAEYWHNRITYSDYSIHSAVKKRAYLQPKRSKLVDTFGAYNGKLRIPIRNWMLARFTTLFVAPQTGDYIFQVKGDDNHELWIAPDENEVPHMPETNGDDVPTWPYRRAYSRYNSGSYTTRATQTSDPIPMIAGNKYWMRVYVAQASGGFGYGVKVTFPDGQHTTDFNNTLIGVMSNTPAHAVKVKVKGIRAIESPGCEATRTSDCDYNYVRLATPQIKDVSPDVVAQGTQITISGTGFSDSNVADNRVRIRRSWCEVISATATEIVCTVPANIKAGRHRVRVFVAGRGRTRGNKKIRVQLVLATASNKGSKVDLKGSGFGKDLEVVTTVTGVSSNPVTISSNKVQETDLVGTILDTQSGSGSIVARCKNVDFASSDKSFSFKQILNRPGTNDNKVEKPSCSKKGGANQEEEQNLLEIVIPNFRHKLTSKDECSVKIGGNRADIVQAWGDRITCRPPSSSTVGKFDILVKRFKNEDDDQDQDEEVTAGQYEYKYALRQIHPRKLSNKGQSIIYLDHSINAALEDTANISVTMNGAPLCADLESEDTYFRCVVRNDIFNPPFPATPVIASWSTTSHSSLEDIKNDFVVSKDVTITSGGFVLPKGSTFMSKNEFARPFIFKAKVKATVDYTSDSASCINMNVLMQEPSATWEGWVAYGGRSAHSGLFGLRRSGSWHSGRDNDATVEPDVFQNWRVEAWESHVSFYVNDIHIMTTDNGEWALGHLGFSASCQSIVVQDLTVEDLSTRSLKVAVNNVPVVVPHSIFRSHTTVAKVTTIGAQSGHAGEKVRFNGVNLNRHQGYNRVLVLSSESEGRRVDSDDLCSAKVYYKNEYMNCTISSKIPAGNYKIQFVGYEGASDMIFDFSVHHGITGVAPVESGTEGGIVTITGQNFGLDEPLTLKADGVTCEEVYRSVTKIHYKVPKRIPSNSESTTSTLTFETNDQTLILPQNTWTYTKSKTPKITSITSGVYSSKRLVKFVGTRLSGVGFVEVDGCKCTYNWANSGNFQCYFRSKQPRPGLRPVTFWSPTDGFGNTTEVMINCQKKINRIRNGGNKKGSRIKIDTLNLDESISNGPLTVVSSADYSAGAVNNDWRIRGAETNRKYSRCKCKSFRRMLGGHNTFTNKRTRVIRVIKNLAAHDYVRFRASIAILDGWWGSEKFHVIIKDGRKRYLKKFESLDWTCEPGQEAACGKTGSGDKDCKLDIDLLVPHTSSTVKIILRAKGFFARYDRSWGILNYEVATSAVGHKFVTPKVNGVECPVEMITPTEITCKAPPQPAGTNCVVTVEENNSQSGQVENIGPNPDDADADKFDVNDDNSVKPNTLVLSNQRHEVTRTGANLVEKNVTWGKGPNTDSISGGEIIKTRVSGHWDSGARSEDVWDRKSGLRRVKFYCTAGKIAMFGLTGGEDVAVDQTQNYADIDFAFYVTSEESIQIWEYGDYQSSAGYFWGAEMLFEMVIDTQSRHIQYFVDGLNVFTSRREIEWPLRTDCSIIQTGARIRAISVIEPPQAPPSTQIVIVGNKMNQDSSTTVTVDGKECTVTHSTNGRVTCDLPVPVPAWVPQCGPLAEDEACQCPAGSSPTDNGCCKKQCPTQCLKEHKSLMRHTTIKPTLDSCDDMRICTYVWGDPHVKYHDFRFDPQWFGWMLLTQCDGLKVYSFAEKAHHMGRRRVTVQTKLLIQYHSTTISVVHQKKKNPSSLIVKAADASGANLNLVALPNKGSSVTVGSGLAEVTISRISDSKIQICTSNGDTLKLIRHRNRAIHTQMCLAPTCNLRATGFVGIHGAVKAERFPLPGSMDSKGKLPKNKSPYFKEYLTAWYAETNRQLKGEYPAVAQLAPFPSPDVCQGLTAPYIPEVPTVDNSDTLDDAGVNQDLQDTNNEQEVVEEGDDCPDKIAECKAKECPAALYEGWTEGDDCSFVTEWLNARDINENLPPNEQFDENILNEEQQEQDENANECPNGQHYCDSCGTDGAPGCFDCSSLTCTAPQEATPKPASGTCVCEAPIPPAPECTTDLDCTFLPISTQLAGECDMVKCNANVCEIAFRPASYTCRAALDSCDLAETCTGSSADCPMDARKPENANCDLTTGGTHTVVITNENGESETTTLTLKPFISTISASSGSIHGGHAVIINGGGFTSQPVVKFGAVVATVIEYQYGWVKVFTPAQAAGTVSISATVDSVDCDCLSDGSQNAATETTLTCATYDYTTTLSPSITTISSSTLQVDDVITVTGTGFPTGNTAGTVLVFAPGSTCSPAADYTNSENEFICTVDSNVIAGSYTGCFLRFPSVGVSSSISITISLTVSISVNVGTLGGATVVFTGSGFGTDEDGASNVITIENGGNPVCSKIVRTPKQCTCTVLPGNFNGNLDVSVNGVSTSVSGLLADAGYNPTITSATTIPVAVGDTIEISGTNLNVGIATVTIGATTNAPCEVVEQTATKITCILEEGIPFGSSTIKVVSDLVGQASGSVTVEAALAVTDVQPNPAAPGETVTVIGCGFQSDSTRYKVYFGENPCTVTASSDTTITCILHSETEFIDEDVDVEVLDFYGGETSSNTITYNHVHQTPASVVSVQPSTGSLAGGDLLVITGTDFSLSPQNNFVKIGATGQCDVFQATATELHCITRPGCNGKVQVLIYDTISTGDVDFTGSLSFDSISTSSVSLEGGLRVTFTGAGFPTAVHGKISIELQTEQGVNTNLLCSDIQIPSAGSLSCVLPPAPRDRSNSVVLSQRYIQRSEINMTISAIINGTAVDCTNLPIIEYSILSTPMVSNATFDAAEDQLLIEGTGFAASGNEVYLQEIQLHSERTPCVISAESETSITCSWKTTTPSTYGSHFIQVSVPDKGKASTNRTCPDGHFLMCDGRCLSNAPNNHNECRYRRWRMNTCPMLTSRIAGDTFCHSNGGTDNVNKPFKLDKRDEDGRKLEFNLNCPLYSCEGGDCEKSLYIAGRGGVISTCRQDPDGFVVDVKPVVTAVTPTECGLKGGRRVTIIGRHLTMTSIVRIGNVGCTVLSAAAGGTELICEPKGVDQAVSGLSIYVWQSGAKGSCSDAVCDGVFSFTESLTPTVTSYLPVDSNVPPRFTAFGVVTVVGTGFSTTIADNFVFIGGMPCSILSANETYLTCDTPAVQRGTFGTPVVRVKGKGYASSVEIVTRVLPTITSLSKSVGSQQGGLIVTVHGTGFWDQVEKIRVYSGSCDMKILSASASQIVAETQPCGATSVQTLRVVSNGWTSAGACAGEECQFSYRADLTPVGACSRSGNVLTITGADLYGSTPADFKVMIGTSAECSITAASSTSITCDLPASGLAAGEYSIRLLYVGFGYGTISGVTTVTYDLTLTSFAPTSGSQGGGQLITIAGAGFPSHSSNCMVRFFSLVTGEEDIFGECEITSITSTEIVCATPLRQGTGNTYRVEVSTVPADSDVASVKIDATGSYTYDPALTPTVTAIEPARGSTAGGTALTLTGTGFSNTMSLTIEGKACTQNGAEVAASTATTYYCTTGASDAVDPGCARTQSLDANTLKFSTVNNGDAMISDGATYTYVDLWSRYTTWGGNPPPGEGDSAVISEGQFVLMDYSPPRLYLIIVMGHVMFDPTVDIDLEATFIMINHCARWTVGTPEKPYTKQATIRLFGDRLTPEIPIHGAKVLALRNGALDMHGLVRQPVWTTLTATAAVGATTITVKGPIDWQVGEYIAVASTSFKQSEHEKRRITAVQNANTATATVTLDSPLTAAHWGESQCFGSSNPVCVDEIAEVMLLTRNIVVEGDESSEINGFGATTHLMPTADSNTTYARISYVEFRNVGQEHIPGRHPVYFYKRGNARNSFITGNSVHDSLNRAYAVQGCDRNTITKNVAFNIRGHAYFFADGSEQFNDLHDNIVAGVHVTTSGLNTDVTPAGFFITNTRNDMQRNRACGGADYGFWIAPFHPYSTGPTGRRSQCPASHPLIAFNDNVAHSNGATGLHIFPYWFPKASNCQWSGADAQANLINVLVYKNLVHGVGMANRGVGQVGAVKFTDLTAADNGFSDPYSANFWMDNSMANEGNQTCGIDSAVLIAKTANQPAPQFGTKERRAINFPQDDNIYFNQVTFVNYVNENWALDPHAYATAYGGDWAYGLESVVSGLRWINSPNRIRARFTHQFIINDLDGTLSNVAGSQVIVKSPIFDETLCLDFFHGLASTRNIQCWTCVNEYKVRRFRSSHNLGAYHDILWTIEGRQEYVREVGHHYTMTGPVKRNISIDFDHAFNPAVFWWQLNTRYMADDENILFHTHYNYPKYSINASYSAGDSGAWSPEDLAAVPVGAGEPNRYSYNKETGFFLATLCRPSWRVSITANTCPPEGCPAPTLAPLAPVQRCTIEADCNGQASTVQDGPNGTCICACENQWTGADCSSCPSNFDATTNCSTCAVGHVNYPFCARVCTIADDCNGNADSVTGTSLTGCFCQCKNQWSGNECAVCPPRYSGNDCEICATVTDPSDSSTTVTPDNYPLCLAGYKGDCDEATDCSGHADAVIERTRPDGSKFCQCSCKDQWSGRDCSTCPRNYDSGAEGNCATCADGFIGYPACVQACSVEADCSGDAESVTGTRALGCTCACRNAWEGADCSTCPASIDKDADCGACPPGMVGYPLCRDPDAFACSSFDESSSWSGGFDEQKLEVGASDTICMDRASGQYTIGSLLVEGRLSIRNEHCPANGDPIRITITSWIHIRGGWFLIGTEASPLTQCSVEIVFAVVDYNNVAKHLLAPWTTRSFTLEAGRLEIMGNMPAVPSTNLAAVCNAGDTTITVLSTAGWKVGDWIAIAGTSRQFMYVNNDRNAEQTEQKRISAIDGNVITLESALVYSHSDYTGASTITIGPNTLNAGAEVVLLSRNIRIHGGHSLEAEPLFGQGWQLNIGCTAQNTRGCGASEDAGFPMSRIKLGSLKLQGVQMNDIGQKAVRHAGIELDGLISDSATESAKGSFIRGCAIWRSWNDAICIRDTTSQFVLERNTIVQTNGDAVRVTGSNNTIHGNVALAGHAKAPDCDIVYDAVSMDCRSAHFRVSPGNRITENIAASSGSAGFLTDGNECNSADDYASTWADNKAYSLKDGLLVMDQPAAKDYNWPERAQLSSRFCRKVGGVTAWSIADHAVMAWYTIGNIMVSNVHVADSSIGYASILMTKENDNGRFTLKSTVSDSSFSGLLSSSASSSCRKQHTFRCRDSLLSGGTWCRLYNGIQDLKIGDIGIMETVFVDPQYTGRTRGEHRFRWTEPDSYTTVRGRAYVNRVAFDGFIGASADCGLRSTAFAQNLWSNDTFHQHVFNKIRWGSGMSSTGKFFARTTYGEGISADGNSINWLNFDDARLGAYWPDAPNKFWLVDQDGSFNSNDDNTPSSILGSQSIVRSLTWAQKYSWDGTWTKTIANEGSLIAGCAAEDVAPQTTTIDATAPTPSLRSVVCTNQFISLIVESKTRDRLTRRRGPVVICKGDGMIDESGNPLCQGGSVDFTSGPVMKGRAHRAMQERMSRWRFIVENTGNYTLFFRGSPSQWMRFWLDDHQYLNTNARENVGITVNIRYFGPNAEKRVGVYVNGRRQIVNFGTDYPWNMSPPQQWPATLAEPGTHYHNKLRIAERDFAVNTMYLTLRAHRTTDLKQEPIVQVSLTLAMPISEFFANKETFAAAMASVLGIDASRLHFAEIVPGTNRRRQSQSTVVNVEIDSDPVQLELAQNSSTTVELTDLASITTKLQALNDDPQAIAQVSGNPNFAVSSVSATLSDVVEEEPSVLVQNGTSYILVNVTTTDNQEIEDTSEIQAAIHRHIVETVAVAKNDSTLQATLLDEVIVSNVWKNTETKASRFTISFAYDDQTSIYILEAAKLLHENFPSTLPNVTAILARTFYPNDEGMYFKDLQPSSPPATPAPDGQFNALDAQVGGTNVSAGAIIGILFGILAFIALIVVVGCFLRKRHDERNNQQKKSLDKVEEGDNDDMDNDIEDTFGSGSGSGYKHKNDRSKSIAGLKEDAWRSRAASMSVGHGDSSRTPPPFSGFEAPPEDDMFIDDASPRASIEQPETKHRTVVVASALSDGETSPTRKKTVGFDPETSRESEEGQPKRPGSFGRSREGSCLMIESLAGDEHNPYDNADGNTSDEHKAAMAAALKKKRLSRGGVVSGQQAQSVSLTDSQVNSVVSGESSPSKKTPTGTAKNSISDHNDLDLGIDIEEEEI